jgi:hypothetical protein
LNVQLWLDTAYPALLATVPALAFNTLARGALVWLPGTGAALTALLDYLENHAVRAMLRAGPDAVTGEMVQRASNFTLL